MESCENGNLTKSYVLIQYGNHDKISDNVKIRKNLIKAFDNIKEIILSKCKLLVSSYLSKFMTNEVNKDGIYDEQVFFLIIKIIQAILILLIENQENLFTLIYNRTCLLSDNIINEV